MTLRVKTLLSPYKPPPSIFHVNERRAIVKVNVSGNHEDVVKRERAIVKSECIRESRGNSKREDGWVDSVESDARVFGITGGLKAMTLDEGVRNEAE